jgi:hypothetical protein
MTMLGFAGLAREWRATARMLAVSFVVIVVTTTMVTGQELATSSKGEVTFARDVAPILQRHCQNCHRPGQIGPMSLLTYQDARPWARSIKQRVQTREMPPWFIDRDLGVQKFKNDVSLTEKDIATIVNWVDGGAPKGNLADMPPPREFEDIDRWHIGEPDLIVQMQGEHTVPADGSDWWGFYRADSQLPEDRYIKAVETKPSPGARNVVHHAATSLLWSEDSEEQRSFLNEYAVGKNGDIYPDNSGKLMKAGSEIEFNMHYHSVGEEAIDRTSVAFLFYPRGVIPKYVLQSRGVGYNEDLDIPAGAENVVHEGYYRLKEPARVTAFQAHLHNRGKAQCMEAIYPDMTVHSLSCIKNYQFGWHIVYVYDDDVAPLVPAGTILKVTSWHDNSSKNRFNPDPKNWVGYGHRSSDDMSFSWVSWYDLSEQEYEEQVQERNRTKTDLD